MEKEHFLSVSNKFFINLIGLVIVFIVLRELQEIFIPLILAFFLFFVFSPLNNYLRNKKVPLFLVIILDVFILLLIAGGISGVIIDSFSRFGEQLPTYEKKLNEIVSSTAQAWGMKDKNFINFNLSYALTRIDLGPIVSDIFSSTFSVIGTLFFVLFFFIFVITGYTDAYTAIKQRYLQKHIEQEFEIRYVNNDDEKKLTIEKPEPPVIDGENKFEKTFNDIVEQMQKYIVTKFFISLFSGFITGLILWMFGVDFYLVWAVITFFFNFIPNIGSIISIILPGLMALVQFESVGYSFTVILVLSIIDIFTGYYIEPRIMGRAFGLNPLILLLALLLWGYVWGIVGVIFSVPLTALIKITISKSDSPDLKFINELISN